MSALGPLLSSVYMTTCPQLAKAAVRAADEGAGFDPYRTFGVSRYSFSPTHEKLAASFGGPPM